MTDPAPVVVDMTDLKCHSVAEFEQEVRDHYARLLDVENCMMVCVYISPLQQKLFRVELVERGMSGEAAKMKYLASVGAVKVMTWDSVPPPPCWNCGEKHEL